MKAMVAKFFEQFNNLYALQEQGVSFETPEELWGAVGLLEVCNSKWISLSLSLGVPLCLF